MSWVGFIGGSFFHTISFTEPVIRGWVAGTGGTPQAPVKHSATLASRPRDVMSAKSGYFK